MAPTAHISGDFIHETAEPQALYYSPRLKKKYNIRPERVDCDEVNQYAQIGYHPNLDQFNTRTLASIKTGSLQTDLPPGWPRSFQGRMAWVPEDFPTDKPFIYELSLAELQEIDSALRHFKGTGLSYNDVSPSNFPLACLGRALLAAKNEVYDGIGCVIFRGLDVNAYSSEELAIILLGVTAPIAKKRGMQDKHGKMIKHLLGLSAEDAATDMPFHTDVVCDVTALLTRCCAATGGNSTMASARTVYNVLAARRPDLINVLTQEDWPCDTFGRDPPFYRRAILYMADDKPIFNFARRILVGTPDKPRTVGIPGLTERQAEALDAVHYTAQAHQVKISMRQGDIRITNNMGFMHGREAYADPTDLAHKGRHLIRVWLHNPDMVALLPPALELAWERVFEDETRDQSWCPDPAFVDGRLVDNDPQPACD